MRMHLSPFLGFLAALSSVAPGVTAAEPAEVIRELRESHKDNAVYRAALVQKATAKGVDVNLRLASVRAIDRLNLEEDAWAGAKDFYAGLLASPDSPAEMLPACASGLARSVRCGRSLNDAKVELERVIAGLPVPAAEPLNGALQALGRGYAPALKPQDVRFLEPNSLSVSDPQLFLPFQQKIGVDLAQSIQTAAEEAVKAKNWVEARKNYLMLLSLAKDREAGAFDGLLKSIMLEASQEKLTEAEAERFISLFDSPEFDAAIRESGQLHLAQALFKENAYDKSLNRLGMLREKFPDGAKRYSTDLLEGLIHSRQGQNENALQIFSKVAGEAKAESEIRQKAQFLIGWTHLFDQNQRAAREAFETLVKEFPDGELAKKAKELLLQIPKANEP